jgi:hypothetical protein
MPTPEYCRRQAELLLSMALATQDAALAERLRVRAEQYLAEARAPDDTTDTFHRAVEDYNDDKMRGS